MIQICSYIKNVLKPIYLLCVDGTEIRGRKNKNRKEMSVQEECLHEKKIDIEEVKKKLKKKRNGMIL